MAVDPCPPSLRCVRAAAGRPHHRRGVVAVSAAATLAAALVPAAPDAPAGVRVTAFGPTGPDVLSYAAYVLPSVSSRLPCSGDVHAALLEALNRLGGGVDRYHRLRLADEARDMLAAYLVMVGQSTPQARASATVRGWVIFQDLTGVRLALAAAARFWRRELDPLAGREGDG